MEKILSKRHLSFMKQAAKGCPDIINRISPSTGKLMEHIGDNTYRDVDTGKVYRAESSVSGQTKQDQILYPLSA